MFTGLAGFDKDANVNVKILATDAPSVFLIPISLVRCSAKNVINPNNPKHATNIAKVENNNRV